MVTYSNLCSSRMDSDSQFEESLSPESTVTSLLSSSGRLKSSLLPPECTTTFRFKNKVRFAFLLLHTILENVRSKINEYNAVS